MGQFKIRNLDWLGSLVRVNSQSPIWQLWIPSRHVISPIGGLLNLTRDVEPGILHFHLYSLHCTHLHPDFLSFLSASIPSLQNTKLSHPSLSLYAMSTSWRQVQHTLSTPSTEVCWSSIYSYNSKLTPEGSISLPQASVHDRLPSAHSPWERNNNLTMSHFYCQLTDE